MLCRYHTSYGSIMRSSTQESYNNYVLCCKIKFFKCSISRIKEGSDIAKETRAKYRYAIKHFDKLNKLQKEQSYYLTFLTPTDFDKFFEVIKSGGFSGVNLQGKWHSFGD